MTLLIRFINYQVYFNTIVNNLLIKTRFSFTGFNKF